MLWVLAYFPTYAWFPTVSTDAYLSSNPVPEIYLSPLLSEFPHSDTGEKSEHQQHHTTLEAVNCGNSSCLPYVSRGSRLRWSGGEVRGKESICFVRTNFLLALARDLGRIHSSLGCNSNDTFIDCN